MTAIETNVLEIKGAWGLLFGSIPAPSDNQLAVWVLRFGPDAVKEAIARAGRKYDKLNGGMDADYISRYIAAVLGKPEAAGSSSKRKQAVEIQKERSDEREFQHEHAIVG
jgi:hypothetical protein